MREPILIYGKRWHRILTACASAPVSPNRLAKLVRSQSPGWFRNDKSKTHRAANTLRHLGWLMYDTDGGGYITTSAGKEQLKLCVPAAPRQPQPIQFKGCEGTPLDIEPSETGREEDEVLAATNDASTWTCKYGRCISPRTCAHQEGCAGKILAGEC